MDPKALLQKVFGAILSLRGRAFSLGVSGVGGFRVQNFLTLGGVGLRRRGLRTRALGMN